MEPAERVLSLCSPFLEELPIDGASISVFSLDGQQSTICATDALAVKAETLQFQLGEGPHWEALRRGASVLCGDLDSETHSEWPMFSNAARGLGISAVFAFPIRLGAATVGVVDLYSMTPRHLHPRDVERGESLASQAAATAVKFATADADSPTAHEGALSPTLRREVHQATGMVQVQLDLSATEAFTRLRAYAFMTGRSIDEISREVVRGLLNLSVMTE